MIAASAERACSLEQVSQELGLPLPPLMVQLQARSRRVVTPLSAEEGSGQMVWHGWQPPAGVAQRGLPLVMLHGGSGSWTHWLRVIEPLTAAGYSLWLADLPGFGESDGVPGGMDVDTMLEPLAYGIKQLLGNESTGASAGPVCDLVGFSFGGMAAGLLAAAYPELAQRLVMVGAPGMGMTEGRAVRLKGWRHLPGLEAQMQAHHHNIAELMLHDAVLIDDETLALHALNVARDRLPRRRLSRTDALAQALTRVQVPVAAIYGRYDPLYVGRLPELHALMQRQCPGPLNWQVMEEAGHWAQHESPAEFCAALQQALP
ncbi:MAG: alpha/beta hydrolase [Comamonas sp.]